MSLQLYLVFENEIMINNMIQKYHWDNQTIEIIDCNFLKCELFLCAYYGLGMETDGIGEYTNLEQSWCKENYYILMERVNNFFNGKTNIDIMYRGLNKALPTIKCIHKWMDFIHFNIQELNSIGFLLHWDIDDDFSNVVVKSVKYSNLTPLDLLCAQEDTLLIIKDG